MSLALLIQKNIQQAGSVVKGIEKNREERDFY